ncbi:ExsB protein [Nautilia profundicola AmH]|uniref:7-cyano-7-deazaguanine synthase n=1 Tax=Nautilia profundicola (strain ATCC BAA-1463 / DSM 18972 / AmH) TaxID=598659 RepID=QUEC_NAUPA|nr:7-cyano-7-deazaguanine synthase QueC [Nautilia profundicola]B9L986.1 RecName: Full=7-cyano-7-deazaguanine synthase; AltName: Full=7-cyano-7-carbaguanine synthase; AltName: Full=PreQ(0) synthase; AltName: Full=Queuosine biosynthesis protein QueC [Nautilia profundicola AmH]ACM92369.1 ExsB protein [Nautilia profundicola AmH]
MKKAVVILSGGMDSTTAAFIAKSEGYEIIPVHFNYSQRTEKRELKAFNDICDYLNLDNRYIIDIPFFKQIGASALVDENIDVPVDGVKPGIPVTYVPFRNGIFLSIAAAVAEKEGAEAIYIGVVEEDSSGYPDCTEDFIQNMQKAVNSGTKPETNIEIKTPLVHLKKEDIVKTAVKYNVPLHLTWSCYKNEDEACGVCDSCRLRLKGFEKAGIEDRIPYKQK